MNFKLLVDTIQSTHSTLQQSALKSVNRHLTIRNWLIGFYIVEFEQKGEDRAKYGERLLDLLAESIAIKGLGARNLKLFRQFYTVYPQIVQTISAQLQQLGGASVSVVRTMTDKLKTEESIVQTASAQLKNSQVQQSQLQPEKLISNLSFSHLTLLFPLNDPLKRTFYEFECIKGNWSVAQLKRQINSLYFERSGMSSNPKKLSRLVQENAETLVPKDIIKSPFTFEFLGLKSKDVVYESDLEQALIDNLEEFLLELGHGFCFEAKQKRILIGEKYYFIDLVFYHRILKCHVLIDLKMKAVEHENIGQLKTYINYYKKHIVLPGDNPPVALLLVTENDKALVEYAMADSDQQLFVSEYMLQLPSTGLLKEFILKELQA